jgi:hypothetical protein
MDERYADIWSLGSHPARLRRGMAQPVPGTVPAPGQVFSRAVPDDAWERILGVAWTLTTSAAAGNRLVAASFATGDGAVMTQVPASAWVPASTAVTGYLSQCGPVAPGAAPDTGYTGSVTGPAAGAAIVTTGALTAGEYNVTVQSLMGGTTAGADANNLELEVNGVVVTALENPSTSGLEWTASFPAITVEAGQAITVNAIGAGTGTAIYRVAILLQDDQPLTCWAQLPDLTLMSGWIFRLDVAGIQSADQLSGVTLLVERFSSDYASGLLTADAVAMARELIGEAAGGG